MNTTSNKTPVFKIISEEEYGAAYFDASDQALSKLGGCADHGDELGLCVWTYQFVVDVTNQNGETRQFTVAFQPEERNNGMKNYTGYDIAAACIYGYDADESYELLQFCDDDATVLDELYAIAWEAAKQEYERLIDLLEDEG